jgi:5-enolpyruvylshikimate-3-phosphate synthase
LLENPVRKQDVTSEVWKALIYISGVITAISKDEMTGKQKKELVIDETLSYLRDFQIPLPEYLLRTLLSQLIEFLYQMLRDKAII